MKRYKNTIFTITMVVFCILSLLIIGGQNVAGAVLSVEAYYNTSAKGMALVEVESGRVLASKNCDEKLKMASTTKIVTAITVIENCDDLDLRFKVDDRAIGIEGTSIYLQKGEELTARELLYGLMLRSGNDASVALAYRCCESVSEFANLMNETAKKAGATNSNFVNPHGLDDANHYTTARDLALITAYAMKNETFKEIVSTKSIKIPHPDYKTRYLANKNRLLNSVDGCVGVKTGYTKGAGRCFVGAVEREGMTLVCVVLNCGPMFEETTDILNEGFKEYQNTELMPAYNYIRSIDVQDGEKAKVKIYCPQGFSYPLSEKEKTQINVEYDLPNVLTAPIKAETNVGTVKVYLGTDLLWQGELLTMEDVDSERVLEQIKDIIKNW